MDKTLSHRTDLHMTLAVVGTINKNAYTRVLRYMYCYYCSKIIYECEELYFCVYLPKVLKESNLL